QWMKAGVPPSKVVPPQLPRAPDTSRRQYSRRTRHLTFEWKAHVPLSDISRDPLALLTHRSPIPDLLAVKQMDFLLRLPVQSSPARATCLRSYPQTNCR